MNNETYFQHIRIVHNISIGPEDIGPEIWIRVKRLRNAPKTITRPNIVHTAGYAYRRGGEIRLCGRLALLSLLDYSFLR